MSTSRRLNYTYADYLRALKDSHIKLEYCDGQIYAMAGGTSAVHAELSAQAGHVLKKVLPASCRVFSSDLRVRVEVSDLSTFPDVTVVCGQREMSSFDPLAVTNPTVLVEVTSRSTEAYDRGDKLSHFKQLPSLRAVLFISHKTKRVTVVQRTTTTWDERDFRAGETVVLAQPELQFTVDAIYDGVQLETE